ncbi:MAG: DUF1092 family protein [Synechococcaceae cyanobacterium SM2_3_60]|nr:DUF1092 family protein [Synechococcaceae cyanobacterium SM2_3_60]
MAKAFGETLPLKELLPQPPREAKAAGVILFSQRALPIAAWMTGVEPAYLKAFGGQNAGLVLESGSRDRQIVARFTTEALRKEGTAFEDRKLDLRGIHFGGANFTRGPRVCRIMAVARVGFRGLADCLVTC